MFLQNNGEKTGGYLFAGGDNGVVFAPVAKLCGLLAPAYKFVGLACHGGDHDRDVMAFAPLARDVPCNLANALYVRDRRAAKFHY